MNYDMVSNWFSTSSIESPQKTSKGPCLLLAGPIKNKKNWERDSKQLKKKIVTELGQIKTRS